MNDPASERLMDIMLSEVLEESAPPDLTDQILSEFSRHRPASSTSSSTYSRNHRLAIATLAASFLCMLAGYGWWLHHENKSRTARQGSELVSELEQDASESVALEDYPIPLPTTPEALSDPQNGTGRELDLANVPFGARDLETGDSSKDELRSTDIHPKLSTEAIVTQLDSLIESAWDHLGIEPTPSLSDAEYSNRIATTLGVSSFPAEFDDLAKAIASVETANQLGGKWGKHIFGGRAWSRLSTDDKISVRQFFASSFRGRKRYDTIVMEMLAPSAFASERGANIWSNALVGKSAIALTDQFCDTMLDLDVACGRCHSHPLEGNLAQKDYWNLNAVLRQRSIGSDSSKEPSTVFYESADGRQVAAKPSVRNEWVQNGSNELITDVEGLARQMRNNEALASASINGLWKIVFGNRLVGRTSDPLAAPYDQFFVAAKTFLAKQLIAHDFDLGKAISWILLSKPMRLSEGISQLDVDSLLVSRQELDDATMRVRSFATFRSSEVDVTFGDMIAMAESLNRAGGLSAAANNTILGQKTNLLSDGSRKSDRNSKTTKDFESRLRQTFPHRSDSDLPAGWLDSVGKVGGFEEQASHLFYVAGFTEPSEKQIGAAKRILHTVDNDALALSQLWWAIKLSQGTL